MSIKKELPDLASSIHQAVLDPFASIETLNETCDISRHYNFSGICTNLVRLSRARKRLGAPNKTKLIAVIAFPFGFIPSQHKQAEAEWAAEHGAEELDVVPNYFALAEDNQEKFAEELSNICQIGLPVRAILNIAQIPSEKLSLAVEASIDAGVRGIQAGNGFGREVVNSDINQLSLMARGRCSIKAVGGVRTLSHAIGLLEAGATSLGTSAGPELIKALRKKEQ